MINKEPTPTLLQFFPDGTIPVLIGPPEGIPPEIIAPIAGYKTEIEGEIPRFTFLYEFENHQEWKDFQKTRILAIQFLGSVVPFNIGPINPEGKIFLVEGKMNGHDAEEEFILEEGDSSKFPRTINENPEN